MLIILSRFTPFWEYLGLHSSPRTISVIWVPLLVVVIWWLMLEWAYSCIVYTWRCDRLKMYCTQVLWAYSCIVYTWRCDRLKLYCTQVLWAYSCIVYTWRCDRLKLYCTQVLWAYSCSVHLEVWQAQTVLYTSPVRGGGRCEICRF